MAAEITYNQPSGAGAGSPGARNDVWLDTQVEMVSSGTGTSWLWELLSKPKDSAATIGSPTASTAFITPDIVGTYRIKLTIDGGPDLIIKVFRARYDDTGALANRGWALPAIDEEEDEADYPGNLRHWSQPWETIMTDVRDNIFIAGGDLSGDPDDQTVSYLRGIGVPLGSTAADGETFIVTNSVPWASPKPILSDGTNLWLANNTQSFGTTPGRVFRVTVPADTLAATIDLEAIDPSVTQSVRDLAEDATYIYATCWQSPNGRLGTIAIIEKATNNVVGWGTLPTLGLVGTKTATTVCADGAGNFYVSGQDSGGTEILARFSTAACLGKAPEAQGPAFSTVLGYFRKIRYDSGLIWAASVWGTPNALERIDPSTLLITGSFAGSGNGMHVLVAFGSVWVTSGLSGTTVYRVDPVTMAPQAVVSVSLSTPSGIGLGPDSNGTAGTRIYVTDHGGNRVSIIDPGTNLEETFVTLAPSQTSEIASYQDVAYITAPDTGGGDEGLYTITGGGSAYTPGLVSFKELVYATPSAGAASGDLSGNYPGPITVSGIQNKDVTSTTPTTGEYLRYSGSQWEPQELFVGLTTFGLATIGATGAPLSLVGSSVGHVPTWTGSAWTSQAVGGLPTASLSQDLVTWNGSAWVAQQPPAGIVNVTLGEDGLGSNTMVIMDLDRTTTTTNHYVYKGYVEAEYQPFDVVANTGYSWRSGAPLFGRYEFDACAIRSDTVMVVWAEGLNLMARTFTWPYRADLRLWTRDYTSTAATIYTAASAITDVSVVCAVDPRHGPADQALVGFIENGQLKFVGVTHTGLSTPPTFGSVVTAQTSGYVVHTDIYSFGLGVEEYPFTPTYLTVQGFAAKTSQNSAYHGNVLTVSGNTVVGHIGWNFSDFSFGDLAGGTKPECIVVRYLGGIDSSWNKSYGVLYGSDGRGADAYSTSGSDPRAWFPWMPFSQNLTMNIDGGYRSAGSEPGFGDFVNQTWVSVFETNAIDSGKTAISTGTLDYGVPVPDAVQIPPLANATEWGLTMVTVKQITQKTFMWVGRATSPAPGTYPANSQEVVLGGGRVDKGRITMSPGENVDVDNSYATRQYMLSTDAKFVRTPICPLGNNRFVVVTSTRGTSADENVLKLCKGDDREVIFGILQEAGDQGDVRPVAVAGGVSRVHSGLVPGRRYFMERGGTLSLEPSIWPIGTALSATELLLDGTLFNASLQRT
jgi:YVTN family beta-propeller protein